MGQLLVNEALPEGLRDHARVLDKKGTNELLRRLAQEQPEEYAKVSKKLSDIGRRVASESGGYSFGLSHLTKSKSARKLHDKLNKEIKRILDDDDPRLTSQKRGELIVRATGKIQQQQIDDVFKESVDEDNPLAMQIVSGSRGNKMNLASLRGSDLLYADHRDNVIPLPVRRSYSEGLTPIEYLASTYGARRGTLATKFAVRDAGFLSKQLNQVAHRLMVVDEDDERDMTDRGLPVDTDDYDSEGSLLARDVGPYKRDTVLTPKILRHLKGLGHDRIVIRSPLVGGSPDGGVYGRDVGVDTTGRIAGRGSQAGLTAAQALSNPLSQGQLSAKHSGGVAGQEKAVGGFAGINQLIQIPSSFRGEAAHSTLDGLVSRIEPAPAGGHNVWIEGEQHYVPTGADLKIKRGDRVEAGDVLSSGIPNPASVVEYKGIGEGRRYFVMALRDAMKAADIKANRRNIELLSRGLINHVRLDEEFGDNVPGDVIPYSTLEHMYQPRDDHQAMTPERATGKYLEKPVLHYSIGTRLRPSVVKELQHFGINEVLAHDQPPPFSPEMIRGMSSLKHDPDWMVRMYGSNLKDSLLTAVHRGSVSDQASTSFVPALARSVDFGKVGPVRQPELGRALPPEGQPLPELPMVKRKPTDRPKSQFALDVQPPPKSFASRVGSLFKMSKDDASEAKVLLLAAARRLKVANTGYIGSSTVAASGVPQTFNPSPTTPGNPPKPRTPGPVPVSQPRPVVTPKRPPRTVAPTRPPVPQPPPATSSGGVNQQRLSWLENVNPNELTEFVAGGGDINNPESGYGGSLGSAVRLGTLIDQDAISALTSGQRYVPPKPLPPPVQHNPMVGQMQEGGGGGWPAYTGMNYGEAQPDATQPSAEAPGEQPAWLKALGAAVPHASTAITTAQIANEARKIYQAAPGTKLPTAFKGVGNMAAWNTAIDAAANSPEAYNNYTAAFNGQDYDEGQYQKYRDQATELMNDENPLSRAWTGFSSPISTIAAGATAIPDVIDIRREGADAKHKLNIVDAKANKAFADRRNMLAEKHQRWVDAGSPKGWIDPVSGERYTLAEYEDHKANQQQATQSNFARDTKGWTRTDKLLHDMATAELAMPGKSDVAIPGTDVTVRRFATPSELFSGNWTWNPFRGRSD